MASPFERFKQKADPEYMEQCNIRLPMRLIVALDQLSALEKIQDPTQLKQPRGYYVAEAIEAYLETHPLYESVVNETEKHFNQQREYLEARPE